VPFADEDFVPPLDLGSRRGADHVAIVVGDFLMQALGRVSGEIAVLVNREALDRRLVPQRRQRLLQARRAVGDDELRHPQPALDEIVEQRAPGGLAFPAHAADRQQHLLAVCGHAERQKERD
jgi:hypothetical protein